MRYCGKVGYSTTIETRPGVWVDEGIIERTYYGDVTRLARRYHTIEQVNDELNISYQISVLADPYALEHFVDIKYVIWKGIKWKVSTVEIEHPRLKMTVGGVYRENDES